MKKGSLDKRMEYLKRQRKAGDLYSNNPVVKKSKKKRKEPKVTNKVIYLTTLSRFQFYLYELICRINGIPYDYYVSVDTEGNCQLVNDFKIDEKFIRFSKLDWNSPSTIDSIQFRGRFVTALLLKIVRRSHKVISSICKSEGDKFSYKQAINIIEGWIKMVSMFVATYLSADADYRPYLFKIEEMFMLPDEIDSKKLFTHILETEDMIASGDEPGLMVNNVTKLAYVLCTHGNKTKKCPVYNEEYRYDDDHLVANQIGELGYAIIKYRQKNADKKLPILYSAFQLANPDIWSRFGGKTDDMPEMVVGLKALEFSKIFYSDRARMDDLIGQMM